MHRYGLPESAAKYILLQRTEYVQLYKTLFFRLLNSLIPTPIYPKIVEFEARWRAKEIIGMYLAGMQREYLSLQLFLPDKCNSILDIGCGVAGIDLFLNQHYMGNDVQFFLLDKSEVEENLYYMFEDRGAFYNSLSVARETLVGNGVNESKVHILEANSNHCIPIENQVDVVVSLLSWGFHYPVRIYLEEVERLLKSDGKLIIDVRRDTDGLDQISKTFGGCQVILETQKYRRICAEK